MTFCYETTNWKGNKVSLWNVGDHWIALTNGFQVAEIHYYYSCYWLLVHMSKNKPYKTLFEAFKGYVNRYYEHKIFKWKKVIV